MSYDISVYPIALKEKTDAAELDHYKVLEFLEVKSNLIDFTPEQVEAIEKHLEKRGYVLRGKSKDRKDYDHKEGPSISAMLCRNGLFFNARGEDIMEISMTAGEFGYYFTLKGQFAVFDTQNRGWQER